MLDNQQIEHLHNICQEASDKILEIYHDPSRDFGVETKDDKSPLTLADTASHNIISKRLKEFFPEIPILSEEGKDIPYATRSQWGRFWLVDPLDGTKEFIKRNGEFTINIALIDHALPVFGIVHIPDREQTYWGGRGRGAWKKTGQDTSMISVGNKTEDLIAIRSRSHSAPEEEEVFRKYNVREFIAAGSALKFCLVADGTADLYYRHGPTMEWDTAAGQAVIEGAGGKVLTGTGPEVFRYNKEDLRNGSFLCVGFG